MRVRNPEGGTYRRWKPGLVNLRADVAVGATNPRKATGAVQDSGGMYTAYPEGPSKPMGAFHVAASVAARNDGSLEDRVVVETTRREPRSQTSGYGSRDRSGRQTKPMRV